MHQLLLMGNTKPFEKTTALLKKTNASWSGRSETAALVDAHAVEFSPQLL